MTKNKFVYFFGGGQAEGGDAERLILGGKGAGLGEMTRIGIPVPPGFTITTETCAAYHGAGGTFPQGLWEQVEANLAKLEASMGRRLGDAGDPLLVSVRSGAAISMPGMMDTVLNLGLNPETLGGLSRRTGSERFALDAYRRFISMFGDVVGGIGKHPFEEAIEEVKKAQGVHLDTELDAKGLREVADRSLAIYRREKGEDFPVDPREQLRRAIAAVFGSWNSQKAVDYRQLFRIHGLIGTAVNVQAMVFGNLGDDSGTGVAFTRDPSTGENTFYGEYLVNAQGEDVVSGFRTPQPIHDLERSHDALYRQLLDVRARLEKHYRDMQDIEFTVENQRLFLLQCRSGKRTGEAAIRIACDLVDEGILEPREALRRVQPEHVEHLLFPVFDRKAKAAAAASGRIVAKGLNAGPGAASGAVVFDARAAEEQAAAGHKVVLVRRETTPEDVRGMAAAEGILTAIGGKTSHAAVVGRGMGKCCVVGCGAMRVDAAAGAMTITEETAEGPREHVVRAGEPLSLDGRTGEVILGEIPVRPSEIVQVLVEGSLPLAESPMTQRLQRVLGWADEVRRLGVRTNADVPHDAAAARAFGAEGIGLCRTEHMFFEGERIVAMREMILADSLADREDALAKLLPIQRGDFAGIFQAMDGLPVTIRLLDPPLHEFLPHEPAAREEVARVLDIPPEEVERRAAALHEMNPMLGHRGCRLGISHPEIYDMQVRAILEAACDAAESGVKVLPEIMMPLVGSAEEMRLLRAAATRVADEVLASRGSKVSFRIGTMIEIPRAALVADKIAAEAEFFSFGTNDLTQTVWGFSRDDVGPILRTYLNERTGVLRVDPFQSLDQEGVGQLVSMATRLGRQARKGLKVGICGEHGGDPASVKFFHETGLDYVSCSPYRVAVARLAAAHAALADGA